MANPHIRTNINSPTHDTQEPVGLVPPYTLQITGDALTTPGNNYCFTVQCIMDATGRNCIHPSSPDPADPDPATGDWRASVILDKMCINEWIWVIIKIIEPPGGRSQPYRMHAIRIQPIKA